MHSEKACGLSGTSRTDIFRDIAVDEISNMIDMEILSHIAAEEYPRFIEFCNLVESEKDSIESVSCYINEDGTLDFSIKNKE